MMSRYALLTALVLSATSLTSSPASAQRVSLRPGNTCLLVLQALPRCARSALPVCTNSVACTFRGQQSRVCTAYRCIPRNIIPIPNVPRPGPGR